MLLVGDIGGTKTTIVLFSTPLDVNSPILEMTYESSEFKNLEDLVASFLKGRKAEITAAVFGAAGPVINNTVKITNLPWNIGAGNLAHKFDIPNIRIINDLEAIANSIPYLMEDDLFVLHEGAPDENCTLAVIAPGTGLGEAYLTWEAGAYHAHASEGGHSDFAPTTKLQGQFLTFMLERYDHVSYERVCSGMGIPNIYSFLRDRGYYDEPVWLADQLAQTDDPTPVIIKAAGNDELSCRLCNETVRMFTSILGAECGNLALKFKATGGVYIGGGMIPKMLDVIDLDELRDGYISKGRFKEFVSKIPIHLILNRNPAIVGAAHFGEKILDSIS